MRNSNSSVSAKKVVYHLTAYGAVLAIVLWVGDRLSVVLEDVKHKEDPKKSSLVVNEKATNKSISIFDDILPTIKKKYETIKTDINEFVEKNTEEKIQITSNDNITSNDSEDSQLSTAKLFAYSGKTEENIAKKKVEEKRNLENENALKRHEELKKQEAQFRKRRKEELVNEKNQIQLRKQQDKLRQQQEMFRQQKKQQAELKQAELKKVVVKSLTKPEMKKQQELKIMQAQLDKQQAYIRAQQLELKRQEELKKQEETKKQQEQLRLQQEELRKQQELLIQRENERIKKEKLIKMENERKYKEEMRKLEEARREKERMRKIEIEKRKQENITQQEKARGIEDNLIKQQENIINREQELKRKERARRHEKTLKQLELLTSQQTNLKQQQETLIQQQEELRKQIESNEYQESTKRFMIKRQLGGVSSQDDSTNQNIQDQDKKSYQLPNLNINLAPNKVYIWSWGIYNYEVKPWDTFASVVKKAASYWITLQEIWAINDLRDGNLWKKVRFPIHKITLQTISKSLNVNLYSLKVLNKAFYKPGAHDINLYNLWWIELTLPDWKTREFDNLFNDWKRVLTKNNNSRIRKQTRRKQFDIQQINVDKVYLKTWGIFNYKVQEWDTLASIIKKATSYGIKQKEIELLNDLKDGKLWGTIRMPLYKISLHSISTTLNIDLNLLKRLNPHLNKPWIEIVNLYSYKWVELNLPEWRWDEFEERFNGWKNNTTILDPKHWQQEDKTTIVKPDSKMYKEETQEHEKQQTNTDKVYVNPNAIFKYIVKPWDTYASIIK